LDDFANGGANGGSNAFANDVANGANTSANAESIVHTNSPSDASAGKDDYGALLLPVLQHRILHIFRVGRSLVPFENGRTTFCANANQ
jgi:hypothetical protein